MNVGEYGNILRFNVGEDISLNTNTLKIKSPYPLVKTKTISTVDGLTVGEIPISTPEGDFLPNQYLEYTIKEGDIFIQGLWEVRVYSKTPDNLMCKITDNIKTFKVEL